MDLAWEPARGTADMPMLGLDKQVPRGPTTSPFSCRKSILIGSWSAKSWRVACPRSRVVLKSTCSQGTKGLTRLDLLFATRASEVLRYDYASVTRPLVVGDGPLYHRAAIRAVPAQENERWRTGSREFASISRPVRRGQSSAEPARATVPPSRARRATAKWHCRGTDRLGKLPRS